VDARRWAEQQLDRLGVRRIGEAKLNRARPWSTTWRIESELGTLWLKACGDAGRYEAALTALLAQLTPEWTLQPLAIDHDRGWLLLPDGGPDLRSALRQSPPEVVVERWVTVLAEYAGMQRRLAGFVPELLAVGVPDLRPESAPDRFRELVAEHAEGPLRDRLMRYAPAFELVCDRLADSAVPASLQHDDLHDAAVLCGADGWGPPAFLDWGDATVGHPFVTLLVTRRVLGQVLDPLQGHRVADTYLERWSDLASMAELRAQLDDVVQLGKVSRAWAWARALQDASDADRQEWGWPVTGWLEELV
jgi:hypothetical protein